MRGVVNKIEKGLVSFGINGGALGVHVPQYSPHCMRDKLSACCMLVMLLTAHLDHLTPLCFKKLHSGKTQCLCELAEFSGLSLLIQAVRVLQGMMPKRRTWGSANGICDLKRTWRS